MAKQLLKMRAKTNINSEIPKGYVVQVISNFSTPQVSELTDALKANGITNMSGVSNISSWWEVVK